MLKKQAFRFSLCVGMVLALAWAPCWAQQPASLDPDEIIADGLELKRQRQVLIDDYLRWALEHVDLDPRATIELATAGESEQQFLGHLARLSRLQAVEATELAIDHIGLSVPGSQNNIWRPGMDLLKAIGPPASALIVRRLRSDPEAEPLLTEALREIEGPGANSLLTGPTPETPRRAGPARQDPGAGLAVQYARLPSLLQLMPGSTPGSVLDLDTGQLHDGPKLDAEWQAAHPDDRLSFLVQQVGALGDVALLENAVLIPGGRYANLGHGNFEAVRGKDLSGLLGSGDVTARIAMGETLLVQMRNGAYALIRYVGRVEGAVFFAYLVQPSGEARFSVARLPSWMELRGRTSAEQLLGHEFLVHQRDIAFWKSYWTMTESLQNVAESPAASQVHRTRARRLLSELRYPTAAQEVPGQR